MFLVHENTSGIVDGICSSTNCWNLDGTEATFTNPMQFVSAYADVWQDSLVTNHRAYLFVNGAENVACFDYLTDYFCSGFTSQTYGYFTYQLVADPNNINCIWYNNHSGTIGNFDATTGNRLPAPVTVNIVTSAGAFQVDPVWITATGFSY